MGEKAKLEQKTFLSANTLIVTDRELGGRRRSYCSNKECSEFNVRVRAGESADGADH